MKHPRYLAILGMRDPFGARRILGERAAQADLACIFRTEGLELFCDREATLAIDKPAAAVLGPIFRSEGDMPGFSPSREERTKIAASRGALLIERCWGDYVAFSATPGTDEVCVLRPPFSDLGCVHQGFRGLRLIASAPGLLRHCAQEAQEPDWTRIANHMLTNGLRQAETCLAGVDELLWGQRMTVTAAHVRTETSWSPWDYTPTRHASSKLATPDNLASALRTTALRVVEARLRKLGSVAVMLSGGLDSSILAACTAAAGSHATCINFTTGDAVGDESDYADRVARSLDLPIRNVELDLASVDLGRSPASGLARPVGRAFAQAMTTAKQAVAAEWGAEAIIDGGGGDNLFCFLQSAAPVADRILCEGLGKGAWRTAGDVATLTESSVVEVLAKAAQRTWLRPPAYRWNCDERFLTRLALERAGPPRGRWLETPRGALPGSAAHIAIMAVVENLLETSDAQIPERSPLMAQPLVELCLSVPSWHWVDRGHNRALARRAFADRLPGEIVWRRSKGTPDGFVARLYETRRAELRDLLCGGRLAAEGLLDTDTIDRTVRRAGPVKGHDHIRLLRIADVEAWVRSL